MKRSTSSIPHRKSFIARRKPLKQKGHLTTLWASFAAKYAEECRARSSDGLIACQCDDHCGQSSYRPDLTHIISKAERPDLYFEKSNLRWQIREHHEKEHATVHDLRPTLQQSQQPASDRSNGQSSNVHQIRKSAQLRDAGSMATKDDCRKPQTVYTSSRRRDDYILPGPKTGSRPITGLRYNAKSWSLPE